MLVSFYTSIPFEGHVYVHGMDRVESEKKCVAVHVWINQVDVFLPYKDCGVIETRNATDVTFSVQLVVAFHPEAILTALDRLINIKCYNALEEQDATDVIQNTASRNETFAMRDTNDVDAPTTNDGGRCAYTVSTTVLFVVEFDRFKMRAQAPM